MDLEISPSPKPKPSLASRLSQAIIALAVLALIASCAWLFYRVDQLERSVSLLGTSLSMARTDISKLASGLDYVTPLAENGNRYAHSHGYSDMRLKKDITPLSGSLDSVLALRGVRFNWNTQDHPEMSLGSEPQIGFIAQEVEQVYPELVTTDANGYKMVDYAKLTPLLVEALKEQQTVINSLGDRVGVLEKQCQP